MTESKKKLGDRGEDAAAAYLERSGMTIVERNWRCKAGEVDIIAIDGEELVLCEVKTR
jgi:putative endonuclease